MDCFWKLILFFCQITQVGEQLVAIKTIKFKHKKHQHLVFSKYGNLYKWSELKIICSLHKVQNIFMSPNSSIWNIFTQNNIIEKMFFHQKYSQNKFWTFYKLVTHAGAAVCWWLLSASRCSCPLVNMSTFLATDLPSVLPMCTVILNPLPLFIMSMFITRRTYVNVLELSKYNDNKNKTVTENPNYIRITAVNELVWWGLHPVTLTITAKNYYDKKPI